MESSKNTCESYASLESWNMIKYAIMIGFAIFNKLGRMSCGKLTQKEKEKTPNNSEWRCEMIFELISIAILGCGYMERKKAVTLSIMVIVEHKWTSIYIVSLEIPIEFQSDAKSPLNLFDIYFGPCWCKHTHTHKYTQPHSKSGSHTLLINLFIGKLNNCFHLLMSEISYKNQTSLKREIKFST